MVQQHGELQRIRVLFLAANPDTSLRLRLDREVRRIEEKLRAGTGGGALDLVTRWAVRPDDLQQAMLKVRPRIVHFSCHGTEAEEIVLEDEAGATRCVGKEALARLFGVLKDEIRVVFLNACHSRPQAEAITRHVDCAIGMRRGVGDAAAIAFAAAFYQALAFGRSIQEAFDLGLITLELEGISRDAAPELVLREGVDAGQLYVCQRRHCSGAALPLPAPFAAPSPYQIPMMSGIIWVWLFCDHAVLHDHGRLRGGHLGQVVWSIREKEREHREAGRTGRRAEQSRRGGGSQGGGERSGEGGIPPLPCGLAALGITPRQAANPMTQDRGVEVDQEAHVQACQLQIRDHLRHVERQQHQGDLAAASGILAYRARLSGKR